jgi:hypothetical protein
MGKKKVTSKKVKRDAPTEPLCNKTQLCNALQISRVTLDKHLLREDAPVSVGKKGVSLLWDLPTVKAYVFARRDLSSNNPDPGLTEARIAKMISEKERIDLHIEDMRKNSVPVADAIQFINNNFGALKQQLMALPNSLARKLSKKSPEQVRTILMKELRSVLSSVTDPNELQPMEN